MEPITEPILGASAAEMQDHMFRFTQENRELREYSERVTKELRRYQAARPNPLPARPEDDLPLPPWASNMQMMSPLLFAYEERIAELEAVVERSVNLAEQSQVLTKENDALRGELQERTEQLRAAQLMAPLAMDSTKEPGAASQQHEDLQELYRLSVEQNEALAQQSQLLKVQIDRMQQNLAAGQQQFREVQGRAVEGARLLNAEQERAEIFERQRSIAEKRLTEVTAELVEEVRLREELQACNDGLQHDLQLQKHSGDSTRKSFNERCSLAADEEKRMRDDLSRVSQNEKENRHRVLELERELAFASDELSKARSEADSTRHEAERMVKLMESMEKRIQYISDRHDHVTAKLTEQENQNNELLTEKDRWSSSEQAAKKQAERMKVRLEDEVERLKLEREKESENYRSSQAKLLADLEERLRRSEQSASEFQSKLELNAKQRDWEKSALERQASVHGAEKSRLQEDLAEAQQTRLTLERQIDQNQQETARVRADLDSAASKAREQVNKATSEFVFAKSKSQDSERQLVQTREEVQSLEARVASAVAEHSRAQSELSEVRSTSAETLDAERRKSQLERQRLQRQLHNVEARAKQDEEKAVALVQAQQELRIKWQNELGSEKDALEAQVERLVEENRKMRENGRRALKSLAAQRIAGARDADDSRLVSPLI